MVQEFPELHINSKSILPDQLQAFTYSSMY